MASQIAASVNNLNLAVSNGSTSDEPSDLSNNPGMNDIQRAQQRFMMMMFIYQQFMQTNAQST